MKKLLVAVFDRSEEAFDTIVALRELHRDGDISMYGNVVLEKNIDNQVTVKHGRDQAGKSWALGLLGGSLIGAFAGPAGLAIGSSVGGLAGMFVDLNRIGVDAQFIDEVALKLESGMTALVVDLDEGWTVPVDMRIEENNGIAFRRNRSEVADDQLQRESIALKQEFAEFKDEVDALSDAEKLKVQQHIDTLNKKKQALERLLSQRLEDVKTETENKSYDLEKQLESASLKGKNKIVKRINELHEKAKESEAKLAKSIELLR